MYHKQLTQEKHHCRSKTTGLKSDFCVAPVDGYLISFYISPCCPGKIHLPEVGPELIDDPRNPALNRRHLETPVGARGTVDDFHQ
jgi:hypothetical protein